MITLDISCKKDLPNDIDSLRTYSWELCLAYQRLSEKYEKLVRKMYGRSSEKTADESTLNALQMEMEELLGQAEAVEHKQRSLSEQDTIEVTSHKRRRKHPGRNAIPEELITNEIVDIPDEEKRCGCGREKVVIDRKPHVVVERFPARYKATRYLRLVYGCSCCKEGISCAEPRPLPIAKGLADVGLLVFVLLSKYQYHLPLYRIQRQIYHESGGIWFTRSTMATWVKQVCGILERVYRALLHQYRLSQIKHADETPLTVKQYGRYRRGWMWVGVSGDGRTAIFFYDNHRSGAAAVRLLQGSREGDYLMIDDCPSYNRPVKEYKLKVMRCAVHIRRNFVEARKSGSHAEYVNKILIKIGQLYRIERLATRLEMSSESRGELRAKYSKKIMSQIKALLDNPGFAILPRTNTGKAVRYFKNNWEEATRFLESGKLPIDNSADERIVRHLAIGRNNWMQCGSENGAKRMAILYTILTTCKLNGIDAHEYLNDVLMRLPLRLPGADIGNLTPVEWFKARNGGKMPNLTPLYPSKN